MRRLGLTAGALAALALATLAPGARAALVPGADSLAATPVVAGLATVAGQGASQGLGVSVASAGDFDGDGVPDVVAGCSGTLTGGLILSRAYVLHGRDGRVSELDSRAGESFGTSVAGVGDFNGDGWDDIVVGAPSAFSGSLYVGRAVVFFGGPLADSLEDLTLVYPLPADPNAFNQGFGAAVAGVGDFNGDGWPDIAVGTSKGYSGVQNPAGVVAIFYGGPGADGKADVIVTGIRGGFGSALAALGDVDGDGYADLMVGAPFPLQDGNTAYLVHGGPTGSQPRVEALPSPDPGSCYFGGALTALGDIDGDGHPDFAVGAPLDPAGGPLAGRVFVYRGGSTLDVHPLAVLTAPAYGGYFGATLAGPGDVDGDGRPDLLVGSPQAAFSGTQTGRVYLFRGGPVLATTPLLTLDGRAANDHLGSALSAVGDLDGDGRAEFVVTASGRDSVAFNAGEARVLSLSRPRWLEPAQATTWLVGETRTVRWRGAGPADVELSLDGGADWSVVASAVGGAAENAYALTVPDAPTLDARLRVSPSGVPAFTWNSDVCAGPIRIAAPLPRAAALADEGPRVDGPAAGARFGARLVALGDRDSDGVAELLVAADDPSPGTPRLSVVGVDGRRRRALATAADEPGLGAALAAGDVDGDGAPDAVAGAPRADGTPGRVLVWRGGAPADSLPALALAVAAAGGSFGAAVAVGDLDGDGRAEIAVGAPLDEASGGCGRVYVFRASAPGAPVRTLTGAHPGDRFGAALAIADLDGDGLGDLVVGAPGVDRGGPAAGELQVFLGRGAPGAKPDLRVTGDQAGAGLGSVLAALGDLNGDGFADFAAGEPLYDGPAGVDAGRALVFLGARVPDALPDLAIDGARAGAWCGAAFAGGDVDGDGFADLLVGAPFDGPATAGRVMLVRGALAPVATPAATWSGAAPDERLGSALAAPAGPDGLADLALGAPGAGADAGAVRLVDDARYQMRSPLAGARWPAGSLQRVAWRGAEPADLALSYDGGATWSALAGAAGGADSNAVDVRVPARAGAVRLRLAPTRAGLSGVRVVEPLTVDRTVTLLALEAHATESGAALAWRTDPPLGPAGVAGYRLYRRAPDAQGDGERIGPDPLLATAYLDPDGVPGSAYTLRALNGLGEELTVGAVRLEVAVGGLAAGPVPAHGGEPVRVSFVAPTDAAGRAPADLEVAVFDIAGRRVATLAQGARATVVGRVTLTWDGRVGATRARAGIYFVRATAPSAAYRETRRIVISP